MPNPQERDTTVATMKYGRTAEEADALIRRLDADREAIMRGRDFANIEDSVQLLRQMREERIVRLTAQ